MKHREGCPVKATIRLLAGKWKVQIFWHLSFGRQLERDGVITRQVAGSVPAAVSYSLNAEGEKLVPIMEALCDWGSAHFQLKPTLVRPRASA
jgi:DNA-binding HxlR family transcriptional regulator